jgi:hypothetical protein
MTLFLATQYVPEIYMYLDRWVMSYGIKIGYYHAQTQTQTETQQTRTQTQTQTQTQSHSDSDSDTVNTHS